MLRQVVSIIILAAVYAAGLATSSGCGLVTRAASGSPSTSPTSASTSPSADPVAIIAAALKRSRQDQGRVSGNLTYPDGVMYYVAADLGVGPHMSVSRTTVAEPIPAHVLLFIASGLYRQTSAGMWIRFDRTRLVAMGVKDLPFLEAPFLDLLEGVISADKSYGQTYSGKLSLQQAVDKATYDAPRNYAASLAAVAGEDVNIDFSMTPDDQGRIGELRWTMPGPTSCPSRSTSALEFKYGGAARIVAPPPSQVRMATNAEYADVVRSGVFSPYAASRDCPLWISSLRSSSLLVGVGLGRRHPTIAYKGGRRRAIFVDLGLIRVIGDQTTRITPRSTEKVWWR